MFMDIVGYSALVQKSESKALGFVKLHKNNLERYSADNNGKVIHYYGDASLTMFDSTIEAIRCACILQKKFHNDFKLPMRIGLHLGEVVLENDSIYGNGVNIASRLESMGVAGSILISESINTELENQDDINTIFIGKYKFKNIAKEINVYAIKDNELVVPDTSQIKSDKATNVKSLTVGYIFGGLIILLAILFTQVYNNKKNSSTVLQERLSIPSFKNFTGNPENDYLGEMVAHRITKELFEIDGTNIIDFQTPQEINQVKYILFNDPDIEYARQAGAVNIIEGSVQQQSKDSSIFSVIIKKLNTGEVIKSFPNVIFANIDPIAGITLLSEYLHGYWQTKDKNLMSFPKLEAYKLYLKAKSFWIDDYVSAEQSLIKAIEIDNEFYDAFDLLLTLYFNTNQREKALNILRDLDNKKAGMTNRQINMLEISRAFFTGDNSKAFNHYNIEYTYNPKDLFNNTAFMVLANEFVHDYSQTLEVFEEINIKNLDIDRCSYCQERLRIALAATLGKKNYKKAAKLVDLFPSGYKNMRSNVLQFRYYGIKNKFNKIKAMSSAIINDTTLSVAMSARYYAARELYITGNEEEAQKYARQHINSYSDTSHFSISWAYYFLGELKNCQESLLIRLKRQDNKSMKDLSLLGIVNAKLNNNEEAERLIIEIAQQEEQNYGDIPYYQSRIQLHLGSREKALELLAESIQKGAKFYSSNVFENDPAFVSIKNDLDFLKVIFPYTQ